ncbi:MAG: phosphotransferase [Micropruina glycogenica]|uniref:Phosphotransferase n=1 Tax=Micropruina glycogenica TaxID=75385 RepID=A0A2N9JGQ0_9ACTN|nr:phosphotransferase [Micropruina glycogenica]SPD87274.1 Phosphotransferase [Micropruina glycogenica]
MTDHDPDGSQLLTSTEVGELLGAAVEHAGGRLIGWALDHVDANPNQSTTATYSATVAWPYGERDELLGVSARASGPAASDTKAEIFADGEREVAVWIYPNDPDLPGLARAAYTEQMAGILTEHDVLGRPVAAHEVSLRMIGYRPRRRAVLRVDVEPEPVVLYCKVLRERLFGDVVRRHELLLAAGVPAPRIAATTDDALLLLHNLDGRPLAKAVFDETDPCTAEDLIHLLDAMPMSVTKLERRPPWTDAVQHYSQMVAAAVPSATDKLAWLTDQIAEGLASVPLGNDPTHGDFHEGQVHVSGGRIVGILDVDTVGPGRRADDLACLIAHLSTIQRMNPAQEAKVHRLIRTWVPVFDTRVDPLELRLRAAAVIISLATGPFRGQEPEWEWETLRMIASAEALVRQVG